MKNINTISIIVLLLLLAVLSIIYKHERSERKRFQANQSSLLEDVTRYKTKDSLNVASIQSLTLSVDEFKTYNSDLTKSVKSLGLKVNRLQSAASTGTVTNTKIKADLKDSLKNGGNIKCLEYKDPYLTVDGCIVNDVFEGEIESRDTIDQFVHRVPKKFLFIKYGTKAIRQEVLSRNPHTNITYSKYIELKK
jgi:hypothetical protein